MKRFAALLVAVGLVVGAWYVRQAITDDDTTGPVVDGDAPTLICATEVAAACERLDTVRIVETENPGVTYARLVGGEELGADAWLVSQPWVSMVNVGSFPIGTPSAALGRSPLELVTSKDRPAGLTCTPVTWACAAEFAATDPQFAHGEVSSTAGLLSVAGLAGGFLGRTDYATNDLADDFTPWFSRVERSVRSVRVGGDMVSRLQTARGTYSAVTALGAGTEVNDSFTALAPGPPIHADVVVAGRIEGIDLDAIRDELDATGWLRSDDKSLPGTNGLPKPGVMVALRDLSS